MNDLFKKSCKYELYIGLTDLEANKSLLTQEHFKECIQCYCTERKIDYSLSVITGGFSHKNGYIIEDSIQITLFGDDSYRFFEAIEEIKNYINTDKVLVTREFVDTAFI